MRNSGKKFTLCICDFKPNQNFKLSCSKNFLKKKSKSRVSKKLSNWQKLIKSLLWPSSNNNFFFLKKNYRNSISGKPIFKRPRSIILNKSLSFIFKSWTITIALMRNCSMIISLRKILLKYWISSHKISSQTPTVLWTPVNFHKPSIYLLSTNKIAKSSYRNSVSLSLMTNLHRKRNCQLIGLWKQKILKCKNSSETDWETWSTANCLLLTMCVMKQRKSLWGKIQSWALRDV